MLRRILSVIVVAGALALGAPAAAHADADYPPPPPGSQTLAGSMVTAECVRDVPWINFRITMAGGDDAAMGREATLVLSRAGEVVEIPLGTLAAGQLSGRVLWPGASVDAAGNPTGWPGWAEQNGQWVPTDGNYAWTRGEISAAVEVGSELAVPLSYPPATAACATGPVVSGAAAGGQSGLAVTGGIVPLAAAGAGIALVVVGGAVVLVRRRRAAQ